MNKKIDNKIFEKLEKIKIIEDNKEKLESTESKGELCKLFFGSSTLIFIISSIVELFISIVSKSFNNYSSQNISFVFLFTLFFSMLLSFVLLYFILKSENKSHLFNIELIKNIEKSENINLAETYKKDTLTIKRKLNSILKELIMDIAQHQELTYSLLKELKNNNESLKPYKKIILNIADKSLKIKEEQEVEKTNINNKIKAFEEKLSEKNTKKQSVFLENE